MIRVGPNGFNVSVNGFVVYLDNWAYIDLAEGDPLRQRRFLDALNAGCDVLFSVTNAAELASQKGRSAEAMRAFLDGIGPRWFPAKLNPIEIITRELDSDDPANSCVDEAFFKTYIFAPGPAENTGSPAVRPVSGISFSLGRIVELLAPQWPSISAGKDEFDAMIKNKLTEIAERDKRSPGFLDTKFPVTQFSPRFRANFVFHNLMRIMAIDTGSLKRGDGFDLCHALVACSFSTLAALDTKWQARVAKLPKPNQLARVYSRSKLDAMVTDLELLVHGFRPKWARASSA